MLLTRVEEINNSEPHRMSGIADEGTGGGASESSSKSHPLLQTRTTTPHDNDVLCGRGASINSHPGNERYRNFVQRKKRIYLTTNFKREKRLIASSIVEEVRDLDPPGRFLIKEGRSDVWVDIGDEKARDKASQALRENAGIVRKVMEEEYDETRRKQAREEAIAAGKDPDVMADADTVQAVDEGAGPFFGRSGYGPLYEAQLPRGMR